MQYSDTFDAVIIGGGAIGCAIALEFTRRSISVAGGERDAVAGNASGFAWGGLSANFGAGVPGPMLEHYKRSIEMHLNLYDDLRDSSSRSRDWELRPVKSLTLAYDESSLDAIRKDVEWMQSEGFNAEMISGDDAKQLEPAITDGVLGASLLDCQWELDSLSYSLALSDEACIQGATIVKGEVVGVTFDGSKTTGVHLGDGTRIAAPIVAAATGPWSAGIKGVPDLPVRPVKGEILRLVREGDDLQHRVGCYGRNVGRKPDGTVWAGTYEWERGFDRDTTKEGESHIMEGVTKYLPSLATAPLQRATACLRPVSSDGIPIVGAVQGVDGLFVANGAGKKGILLSPLIAQILADAALEARDPPSEMNPMRFQTD